MSSFVRPEIDTRFSQQIDYLNGFEYVQTKDNRIVASAINGQTEANFRLGSQESQLLLIGTAGKYSNSSLSVINLSDKNLFDAISQQNHYYTGYQYQGEQHRFSVHNLIMGNEMLGFTTGIKLGYASSLWGGKLFFNMGIASGKMTHTLNGQMVDSEIGFQKADFVMKGYTTKTDYNDALIVKSFNTDKLGFMIGKVFNINWLSNSQDEKFGLSMKLEKNQGRFDLLSAQGFDASTSMVNVISQNVDYETLNQYLGVTYMVNRFKVLGLYDVNSVMPNSGLLLNYSKQF